MYAIRCLLSRWIPGNGRLSEHKEAQVTTSQQQTVTWKGRSGTTYTYWVYAIPAALNRGQDGNYIYAKVVDRSWQPIYIGQGDLGDRTDIDNHHRSRCLRSKGATHVHAHKNGLEADRRAEEQYLLAAYPQAYEPGGCNERTGG